MYGHKIHVYIQYFLSRSALFLFSSSSWGKRLFSCWMLHFAHQLFSNCVCLLLYGFLQLFSLKQRGLRVNKKDKAVSCWQMKWAETLQSYVKLRGAADCSLQVQSLTTCVFRKYVEIISLHKLQVQGDQCPPPLSKPGQWGHVWPKGICVPLPLTFVF